MVINTTHIPINVNVKDNNLIFNICLFKINNFFLIFIKTQQIDEIKIPIQTTKPEVMNSNL